MKAQRILEHLYRWLTHRPVYHGLFWLVLLGILFGLGYTPEVSWWFAFSTGLINAAFFAVLVYFNLLYLIPRYLARHTLLYLGLVLLAVALVTPIRILALYLRFSGYPQWQQALVNDQLSLYAGGVLVTLTSTVLRVITDWWRYQQEKQLLQTQTIQSELRFLKSQINPHFLFNTLNNLYALTLKKSDKAPEIVLKLSEIMRYMLYECNERQVPLEREVQYIHNYLDLERLRQPKGDIRLTIEGSISDQMIAPLIFVPFLENSFKHGLNHHAQGGGYVHLHLRVEGKHLEFFIENSKPDPPPPAGRPGDGGIGLANVRQRLDLLYPGKYALKIQEDPKRYTVILRITLE